MPPADSRILKVALDVPLDTLFDYLDGGFEVAVGQRVIVSFGPRKQVGIVAAIVDTSEFTPEKLKPILKAFTDEPPLNAELFRLLKFCADYYQYPFGQALLSVLPVRLRQTEPAQARKQFAYCLTEAGHAAGVETIPARSALQRRVYTALLELGELGESALAELSATWRKAIQAMTEMGWV
ncbi:MAG TPA: primosomal protein N', partial [Methylophilaceae bacterium]|nr:primosomal protein N' [Methylophilaceae bacterium]